MEAGQNWTVARIETFLEVFLYLNIKRVRLVNIPLHQTAIIIFLWTARLSSSTIAFLLWLWSCKRLNSYACIHSCKVVRICVALTCSLSFNGRWKIVAWQRPWFYQLCFDSSSSIRKMISNRLELAIRVADYWVLMVEQAFAFSEQRFYSLISESIALHHFMSLFSFSYHLVPSVIRICCFSSSKLFLYFRSASGLCKRSQGQYGKLCVCCNFLNGNFSTCV